MLDLYLNKESDYSEENTSYKEDFCSALSASSFTSV